MQRVQSRWRATRPLKNFFLQDSQWLTEAMQASIQHSRRLEEFHAKMKEKVFTHCFDMSCTEKKVPLRGLQLWTVRVKIVGTEHLYEGETTHKIPRPNDDIERSGSADTFGGFKHEKVFPCFASFSYAICELTEVELNVRVPAYISKESIEVGSSHC